MENFKPSHYHYSISEFMWRDLGLKPASAIILAIIIGYGGYQCNIEHLMEVIGATESTVRKYLSKMKNAGIIICKKLFIKTNVTRNIYVSIYNRDGTQRTPEEIQRFAQEGISKCLEYYDKRGKYRKGCKRNKKYTS